MGKAGFLLSAVLDLARLGLAVYSVYIKQMIDATPDYKAQCDISDYVSCSKTFNSKYGRGFGLLGDLLGEKHPLNMPNGIYGTIFFFMHLLLVLFARGKVGLQIRLVNSVALTIGCGWLAYTMLFILKHLCIVCIPMYCLNVVSLVTDAWQLRSRARVATTAGASGSKAQQAKKKRK